jgi:hypothetical protein
MRDAFDIGQFRDRCGLLRSESRNTAGLTRLSLGVYRAIRGGGKSLLIQSERNPAGTMLLHLTPAGSPPRAIHSLIGLHAYPRRNWSYPL